MIVGVDISEFQGQVDWSTLKNNTNFVFIRSSYGVGYFDQWFGNNRTQARQTSVPHGFYHYAYPEYNTPENEADWFLSAIGTLQDGEVLALDFEENYTGDKVDWCKRFLDRVQGKTTIKPFIYLNQALCQGSDWTPVISAGYALWIAAYTYDPNNNTFQGGVWQTSAIQQWTDKEQVPGLAGNVDGDVFFGTQDQFKAYGYTTPQPIIQSPAVIPVQPAPVVEVTPMQVNIPVTTTSGETNVPVVITSTPTPSVPTPSEPVVIPPVHAKPIAKKTLLSLFSKGITYIKSLFIFIFGN